MAHQPKIKRFTDKKAMKKVAITTETENFILTTSEMDSIIKSYQKAK